jgi:hypothetical protein
LGTVGEFSNGTCFFKDGRWLCRSYGKEYEDIFQPISLGLPSKREIAPTIPLKEGDKPPLRPIYRLNPLEIEEAKKANNKINPQRMDRIKLVTLWIKNLIC